MRMYNLRADCMADIVWSVRASDLASRARRTHSCIRARATPLPRAEGATARRRTSGQRPWPGAMVAPGGGAGVGDRRQDVLAVRVPERDLGGVLLVRGQRDVDDCIAVGRSSFAKRQ